MLRAVIGNVAAARRPQLSVNMSCPHDAQQQTRRTPLLLSTDETNRRTDRQTDGRSPNRYIDPVPHTMRSASMTYCLKLPPYCKFCVVFWLVVLLGPTGW